MPRCLLWWGDDPFTEMQVTQAILQRVRIRSCWINVLGHGVPGRHPGQRLGTFTGMWLTQVVRHKVQITEAEAMDRIETWDRHWPISVDELEAPKADAATEGRTESASDIGGGCHRCPDHKRECVTFPNLARQLLVF
jgi:hypothetical protein